MNATQHTEGQWSTIADEDDFGGVRLTVQDSDLEHPQGRFVVATINRSRGAESRANARLIAAAPDLLEACEAMLHIYRENPGDEPYYFPPGAIKPRGTVQELARAAIARATT